MKRLSILLLITCLMLTSCKPALKTEKEPEIITRSAEVLVLAYSTDIKGEPIGVARKIKITVEPNPEKDVRVGFYESEVSGSGPMWRAAGWMATVVSALLQGKQLSDYRFSFDIGGRIDGPSAGALKTIGVLSCLIEDKLKEDVSMTGTINPDGTIGPVGGIPQKIGAALKEGKKLVLIPLGQRYDYDQKTKQTIDVIEHGRRIGIEVKEVGDIYEAYKYFTGLSLPQPEELTDVRPELPTIAYEKTKSKAKEWYSHYQKDKAYFDGLPKQIRDLFGQFIEIGVISAQRAENYLKQGLAASFYSSASQAALYTMLAYQLGKLTKLTLEKGFVAAEENLKASLSIMTKIDAVIDRLNAEQPRSLSDSLALIGAYGYLSVTVGLRNMASSLLSYKPDKETQEQAFERLATASLLLNVADYVAESAQHYLDIGVGFGTAPPPSEDQMKRLSEAFKRTAEANIVYFDASVLEPMAKKSGVSISAMQDRFANIDFSYSMSVSSMRGLAFIQDRLTPGISRSYAALGSSLVSYVLSSALIAKWYSLKVKLDDQNNIIGIESEKALIEMLDLAEKKARQNIQLSLKVGVEPITAILAYEDGKVNREGSVEDKLGALSGFWHASSLSLIAYQLSGKAKYVR